jgi:SAM-dependent methyltransferase
MTPTTPTAHSPTPRVSDWVMRWAAAIRPAGSVLDVACGSGRHAQYLAARGHRVEAVDRDAAALAMLEKIPGITTRCADLEAGAWPFEGAAFDAIVVTNYLYRPLLPAIAAALAAGGVLIYETFRTGNESYGKPSSPAFLLHPGELLAFALDARLQVAAFEDGYCGVPRPAMVQRICALKLPLLTPEQVRLE